MGRPRLSSKLQYNGGSFVSSGESVFLMKQVAVRSIQIAGIVVVIAILSFAYRWGKRSALSVSTTFPFRVTGQSMAPTYLDGDVCHLMPLNHSLQIGDVVAIQWGEKRRLKRVAALAGDSIDLRQGRLLVNGRRLEDTIAARPKGDFVAPALVVVSSERAHWNRGTSDSASSPDSQWIIYEHRNPHQAGENTPIMDDYPINVSVSRILNPVDRLVVQLRPTTTVDASEERFGIDVQVAFFDGNQILVTSTDLHGYAWSRNASQPNEPMRLDSVVRSIDASHPIAIKLNSEQALKTTIHVYREIEYRDDQPSGEVDYPLKLRSGEVFVVGDNVPISVDSRHIGALKTDAIFGRVLNPGD